MDPVVVGYQDSLSAQRDFEISCGLVDDAEIRTVGVIWVAKHAGLSRNAGGRKRESVSSEEVEMSSVSNVSPWKGVSGE